MGNGKQTGWLNAAECATRTGMTVRALRIYERHGLIAPLRGENGWRHYGHKELVRLNNIALLKAAGLTLAQIRTMLDSAEPVLAEVMRRQIDLWKQRKAEAETGLNVAETLLNRLQSRRSLSLDDLCQLMRNFQLWSLCGAIDRHIPAQEQRKWNDWWADHASETADATAFGKIQETEILLPMISLMQAGADPSSPEVQDLIMRGIQLMSRYGIREAAIQAGVAAPSALSKSVEIGRDLMEQAKQHPDNAVQISVAYTPGFPEFNAAALRRFPLYERLRKICGEFALILEAPNDPASPGLGRAVERFEQLCRDYDLGEPGIYARWSRNFEPYWAADCRTDPGALWDFIVQALETDSKALPTS